MAEYRAQVFAAREAERAELEDFVKVLRDLVDDLLRRLDDRGERKSVGTTTSSWKHRPREV